ETLKSWKENGCVEVIFGIESGSPTILKVMEKNATIEMNINALKWTYEAGLSTIIQIVIGMPGETDKTIKETISFLKEVTQYLYVENDKILNYLSINYAQALPGTPLYEYARENGYINSSIDGEESYLENISDTDAYRTDHFINYTKQPLLKVLSWRHLITAEVEADYMIKNLSYNLSLLDVTSYFVGLVINKVLRDKNKTPKTQNNVGHRDGYFNIKQSVFSPLFMNKFTSYFAHLIIIISVAFLRDASKSPLESIKLIFEYFMWTVKSKIYGLPKLPNDNLRKFVQIYSQNSNLGSEALRLGR
ncbi:MAG: radical SAM protein, partial [Candidatus Sericytochromatia bacterium]